MPSRCNDGEFDNLTINGSGTITAGSLSVGGALLNANTKSTIASGQTFGVFEGAYEIDFGDNGRRAAGIALNGTDDALIATVATLPLNCTVLDATMICSETFPNNTARNMDLVIADAPPTTNQYTTALTVRATLIAATNMASGASGAQNTVVRSGHATAITTGNGGAAASEIAAHGAATATTQNELLLGVNLLRSIMFAPRPVAAGGNLCLINRGTGNNAAALTAGKVIVYIKYIGNGPPVENTSL